MIFQSQSEHKAEMYSLSIYKRDYLLSPHFTLGEMASKDGADTVRVHPSLIALLETVRAYFDKPVIINSGYRTPTHNRKIGGATQSKHVLGMAADVRIPGISPEQIANYVDDELEAGGVGLYDSWAHIDVWGYQRRWTG